MTHKDVFKSEGDVNASSHRQAWAARNIDAATRELLEADARVFLHQALSTPCLNAVAACEGSYLIDLQGRRYLDFHGNSVHQVGFANPRVIEAMVKQMQSLAFSPRRYTNRPAVQLAEKLTSLAPRDLNRVLFAPSGAVVMSIALQLARAATGRHKTISMWDSFHGATLDCISVGGEAFFRRGNGPLLPGCEHVPPADPRHCPFGCGVACNLKCADYIEYVLEKEGDVAAVVGETIRSAPFIPPPDYWKRIRAACDKHGALLILDEIPNGLGRTGRMFACEHYDVVPDILLLGKGLGGGIFPLAAILAREHLNVAADRALGHFTHEKSPVGAAAALATLQYIEDEKLVQRAQTLGAETLTRLREMMSRHSLIGDVRGLGLALGVELTRDRATMARATDEAERVLYNCLDAGLSFKVTMGSTLTLYPPLTISDSEMASALQILESAIGKVEDSKADGLS
jgi:4-aminobutyrate aminotransferase